MLQKRSQSFVGIAIFLCSKDNGKKIRFGERFCSGIFTFSRLKRNGVLYKAKKMKTERTNERSFAALACENG